MQNRIPCFLALRLSVQRFQMPFEGLSPRENVGNVWSYQRKLFSFTKYDFRYFLDQTHLMLILLSVAS